MSEFFNIEDSIYINNDTNVGIGITNPDKKFEVVGDIDTTTDYNIVPAVAAVIKNSYWQTKNYSFNAGDTLQMRMITKYSGYAVNDSTATIWVKFT